MGTRVSVNHFRNDPTGWFGSFIMIAFAGYALCRWHSTGLLFFILLLVRDLIAAWFLLTRKPSSNKSGGVTDSALAYISCGWAFTYVSPEGISSEILLISSLLAIFGFTLATLALLDLGRSFGVSPANRGLIDIGTYRYFSHPMYLGYLIAESGFVFLSQNNLGLYLISVLLYFLRIRNERTMFSVNPN